MKKQISDLPESGNRDFRLRHRGGTAGRDREGATEDREEYVIIREGRGGVVWEGYKGGSNYKPCNDW